MVVAELIKRFLLRVFLPTSFLIAALLRPSLLSIVYATLALVGPAFPTIRRNVEISSKEFCSPAVISVAPANFSPYPPLYLRLLLHCSGRVSGAVGLSAGGDLHAGKRSQICAGVCHQRAGEVDETDRLHQARLLASVMRSLTLGSPKFGPIRPS
jgi:hypothetical protein